MIVTIDQLRHGVTNFIDAEIGQRTSGVSKFAIYFALPSITANVDKGIDQLRSSALADGMFDDNGNIDLDAVHARAVEAMRRCDNVEIAGIRFREADINALRDYIERA